MKNKKIMHVVIGFMFILGLYSVYNWFPRIGWVTTTAKFTSSPEVEYYLGTERVVGKLSGGGDSPSAKASSKNDEYIRVQYNPDEPSIVRVAPTAKQFFLTILLFGGGFALLYIRRKH